jgi:predicted transcriptional regulator
MGATPQNCAMAKRPLTISVRVSQEMKDTLERIAAAERRTIAQVVFIMIEDELARRQAKTKKT